MHPMDDEMLLITGEISGSTGWKDIPPQEVAESDRAPSASYSALQEFVFRLLGFFS